MAFRQKRLSGGAIGQVSFDKWTPTAVKFHIDHQYFQVELILPSHPSTLQIKDGLKKFTLIYIQHPTPASDKFLENNRIQEVIFKTVLSLICLITIIQTDKPVIPAALRILTKKLYRAA